ncbi:hypothetical protein Aduo_010063 [Ancylostoma duodenale]
MAPRKSGRSRAHRASEVKKHSRTEQPPQLVHAAGDNSVSVISDLLSWAVEVRRSPRIRRMNLQPLRRSPRLVGKVIDYRPMLGMRVPKPRTELRSRTPKTPAARRRNTVTCMIRDSKARSVNLAPGSAHRSAPSKTSPDETPQGRKRKGNERRRLNTSLSAGTVQRSGSSQENVTPQRRTKQLVLVRTTTTRTCNHENMTHDQIVASRNRAISGRWLTLVRTAFDDLVHNYPRPFSMQDIRNVVAHTFPGVTSEQFENAVYQLIHRVTECYGSSEIRRDTQVVHALSYQ